jgi:hypothetical protein
LRLADVPRLPFGGTVFAFPVSATAATALAPLSRVSGGFAHVKALCIPALENHPRILTS